MGRLAGFRYKDIIRRLKKFGFEFNRQAAGSHEIWFMKHKFSCILKWGNHKGLPLRIKLNLLERLTENKSRDAENGISNLVRHCKSNALIVVVQLITGIE